MHERSYLVAPAVLSVQKHQLILNIHIHLDHLLDFVVLSACNVDVSIDIKTPPSPNFHNEVILTLVKNSFYRFVKIFLKESLHILIDREVLYHSVYLVIALYLCVQKLD